jgi:dienelactone hydrolase
MAKIITASVEYKDGEQIFKGYVAYDDSLKSNAPGILVVHEWWGLTDYPKNRAKQLAELGYVAFCADIYGEGNTTDSWDEAPKLAGQFWSDPALFSKRVQLALEQLKLQPHVDANRIAAIGYCFGGMGVLALARSGAELDGVVAFHGGFEAKNPDSFKNIKCKVLACHGADDPFETPEDVTAFKAALDSAKVDYKFVAYPGAVHAFTNPGANAKEKGVYYNAVADKRSWEEMKHFFTEIFK